jgi:glycosyltransferase involved in cell wall biosynthesis
MALRVTFVTPHRRSTSGGVYVIDRFACGLAQSMDVHLAVQKGDPGSLPGVTVGEAPDLDPAQLPDADVLLVPADSPAAEHLYSLPPRKGRPVLLFQGYGTPGSPVVSANLKRADVAIAVASWLTGEAARYGCEAVHVPLGFDRDLFAPGPPAGRRAPLVALLAHSVSWKGTEDGLAALAEVRRAMPETQVRLFGPSRPESQFPFLESPGRDAVGELLRGAAVYVCPSWEEGFGLPGLEALACGAALATTDTKGSRDYAEHGRTALVSEPHDTDALAENVLTLLRDRHLRGDLAGAGSNYVHCTFDDWLGASARLGLALKQLAPARIPDA